MDDSQKVLLVLKDIYAVQAETLELHKAQFKMFSAENERTERIQLRAEKIQSRAEQYQNFFRKVIIPFALVLFMLGIATIGYSFFLEMF